MSKQDARTRYADELDAWVAAGDPSAPMPDGAAYRKAVLSELASRWTDECWREIMAERRLQSIQCDAVDLMRAQQRDASIASEARRALIEEVAAAVDDFMVKHTHTMAGEDEEMHAVMAFAEDLIDELRRRFGGPQEEP